MIEIHCKVTGDVQGVGFRQTAKRCALNHQLSGFAKNLDDGSVDLRAQGKEENLKEFLAHLRKEFPRAHFSVEWCSFEKEYSGFTVQGSN